MTTQPMCDLANKKCVPCEGGVPRLSLAEATTLGQQTPGWVINGDASRIRKEYRFKHFRAAMAFLNQVAEVAEAEAHHPDVHLERYREVAIEIWTHAIGGLSENDFILAAKIDALGS